MRSNRQSVYNVAMIAREKLAEHLGSKPAPGDLALVQAFINTWVFDASTDPLQTPHGLRTWLSDLELIEAGASVTDCDVRHAHSVREALRTLAHANNGGPEDPNALDTLNRAARSAQLAIGFQSGGRAGIEPRAPGVDGALGQILVIALDAMADGIWARLKACPADDCRWVFYDETKNRSGTWCSMRVCGNRTKAREYRRRHTHAGAAGEVYAWSPSASKDSGRPKS